MQSDRYWFAPGAARSLRGIAPAVCDDAFRRVSLANRPVLQAVLALALVMLRGKPGLMRLSDTDLHFVDRRARLVSVVSTGLFFLVAIVATGALSAWSVVAGSVWGTICLKQVLVVLDAEHQRRDPRAPRV